jgi:hypothetical protein
LSALDLDRALHHHPSLTDIAAFSGWLARINSRRAAV